MWLMRQAGRYLPEYRALRAQKGGFLDLAYDPESAAEITLQPLRRFAFDGAILFSDILIVPHAIGQELSFVAGEGPRLAPPLSEATLDGLAPVMERLKPIWATVRRVKAALAPEMTFLGFAGSPWTVATYMVAGQGSREQAEARTLAYLDPGKFDAIIRRIEAVTLDYLSGQIEAGVDAVQLFDSWSGSLAPAEFERWVIAPTVRLVEGLRQRHPDVPIIGFPKGAGGKIGAYARETGVDAVGIDETVDPVWAHRELPGVKCCDLDRLVETTTAIEVGSEFGVAKRLPGGSREGAVPTQLGDFVNKPGINHRPNSLPNAISQAFSRPTQTNLSDAPGRVPLQPGTEAAERLTTPEAHLEGPDDATVIRRLHATGGDRVKGDEPFVQPGGLDDRLKFSTQLRPPAGQAEAVDD